MLNKKSKLETRKRKSVFESRFMLVFLIVLIILGSIFCAIYIKSFVGFVVSIPGKAGYITKLLIEQRLQTSHWQGFYGLALMLQGYDEVQYENAYPGEVKSKHLVFNCLEPNIDHEVYASLVHPNSLDWSSVKPATPEMVEDYFNISSYEYDSPTITFTHNGSVMLGANNITGIPMTYTKKYGDENSTAFNLGILNVSGDLVFFTKIADVQTGFNNQKLNYQMILPTLNGTLYYFFADPNDNCPSGLGIGYSGDGFVYGIVIDNSTNQTLSNVTIGVGGTINYSDGSGFYNISTKIGYQYLVAIKEGYYIYTALVNITLANGIERNISMVPFPSQVGNGTIYGTVVNNKTNQTLSNVTILIAGKSILTDENGFYNSTVPEGNHTIIAMLSGYGEHIGFVVVPRDSEVEYNISLEPLTGTVEGFAIDNSTGEFVSNVTVGIGGSSVLTNGSGAYSITANAGEHFIIGVKQGYENYVNNITVLPGKTIKHNLTMVPSPVIEGEIYNNGTVQGYVTNNLTSEVIQNATVTIAGVFDYTDENGFYNISIVEGRHNIVAIKTGYENFIGEVNVSANNITIYNISMSPFVPLTKGNGTIKGTITNTEGAILEGVIVSLAGQSTTSNSSGGYNLTVPEGTYNLVAVKSGYDNYFAQVEIVAGNTTIHDIVMNSSIVIVGKGPATGTGEGKGKAKIIERILRRVPVIKEIKRLDYKISINKIIKSLRIGSFLDIPLTISNLKKESLSVMVSVEGDVAPLVKIDKKLLSIASGFSEDLRLTLIGKGEPGVYEGNIVLSGDINEKIPLYVLLYDRERLPIEALLVRLRLSDSRVPIGGNLRYRVDIQNLLRDEKYNVRLVHKIVNKKTGKEFLLDTDYVDIKTSFSVIKTFPIDKGIEPGEYQLKLEVRYLDMSSEYTGSFKIVVPIYRYAILGIIPLWLLLVCIGVLATSTFVYMLYKKKKAEEKRYRVEVDFGELPPPGPRSAFVGNIADTSKKVYFDLDKFQIHTLVAGASGSGKTVAAQILVEEALLKNASVLVFDPTGVWTGFLRKCQDKKILDMYPRFGMKKTSARAFNGNVHLVFDYRELIDIKKYLKPGEINIFVIDKLDTKGVEFFVANTIKQVFKTNLPESPELKYLLVYDGVHTLLPKFGGSGKVFVQIERATREFRKWGVGLVLISQVVSDIAAEVLANVNTEIQMRTRDEGDLKRIKEEYGDMILKSVVKAGVGTGMVENSAYNKGKPFFVAFRPVLHSLQKLKDEELQNYNKYNLIIDDLEYQLEQLRSEGIDTFDLELELKLAKDKVKSGNFNLVDIYLDGLKPRIKSQWDKIGKKPKKREVKLADVGEDVFGVEENKNKETANKEIKAGERTGKEIMTKGKDATGTGNREDVVSKANDILREAYNDLRNGNIGEAKNKYAKLSALYRKVPNENKQEIYKKCLELRNAMLGKR